MRRRQLDGVELRPQARRLSGNLGTVKIAMMVVAMSAPLGAIAASSALATAFGNGVGVPGAYVVVAALFLLFCVALTTMTRFVKNAGAFYAYVGRGLGPTMGMVAASLSWVTYTALHLGTLAYFGFACNGLVTSYGGPDLPFWCYSLLGGLVMAYLGYRNIELTAKVLGVALALEILTVVVVDIAIGASGGAAGINFDGFAPSYVFESFPAFVTATLFCGPAFIGFEATAVYREEARNPDVTIPRATYLAIGFIGAFYAISTWLVALGWKRDELADAATQGLPFFLGPATEYVGPVMKDVVSVLLVTSVFAAILAIHNVLSRYQHVLARSRVLPQGLAAVHRNHGAPSLSSFVQSCTVLCLLLVCTLLGMDPLAEITGWFVGLAGAMFFSLLAVTCLSAVAFFARTGLDRRWWQARIAPTLGFVGIAGLFGATIVNFDYLVGPNELVRWGLVAVIPATIVSAVVFTRWVRIHNSERFASIVALTEGER